jgi:hypothetical protein
VDPLAEKYFNASPYIYVENNPIVRIDPDGRDWYVNEANGNLYFNKDEKRDQIEWDNSSVYVRLGENDYFGETAFEGQTYMYMAGETAKDFASQNGFKKVTSQVEVTNDEIAISVKRFPLGSTTIINGTLHTEGIGSTYVENDKQQIGVANTKHSLLDVAGAGEIVATREVYQERIVYGYPKKENFIDLFLKFNPSIIDSRIKTEKNVSR